MAIIRPNPLTDELKQTIAAELNAIATQHTAALEFKFKKGCEITAGGCQNPEALKFLVDSLSQQQAPAPHTPAPAKSAPTLRR